MGLVVRVVGFFGCYLSLDYRFCCESGRLWVMDLRCCGLREKKRSEIE